jgi:hypothetical protein
MKKAGMRLGLVLMVALLVLAVVGCDNLFGSDDSPAVPGNPGQEDPGGTDSSVQSVLANLAVDQGAQVPESLLSARGSGGVVQSSGFQALATFNDADGDVGVFGRVMWDLMYNWLLDLVENPTEGSTSRLFLALLKDVASDPDVPFAYDTPIDLGVRPLPAGTSGPDGETELDLGTFVVSEESATRTVLYWSIPFDSLAEAPDGGVYYIRLDLIEGDSDSLRVETRMGFQPNGSDGNPLDMLVENYFEAIDSNGGIFAYNWYDDEYNTFQQYTDSDGMLRTMFNTSVLSSLDGAGAYGLLFLMIGDDTMAGINSYSYRTKNEDGSVVENPSVQRTFEAYNQHGFLISQVYYDVPQPYRYPLKYVAKAGHTLATDGEAGYWLDSAGDDTYNESTDINLTVGLEPGAASVAQHTENTGEYTTWESGKTFIDRDIWIYSADSAVTGLDSAPLVTDVQGLLESWYDEIVATGTIDLTSGDIVTLPDTEAAFYAALGLPIDPAEFPTP